MGMPRHLSNLYSECVSYWLGGGRKGTIDGLEIALRAGAHSELFWDLVQQKNIPFNKLLNDCMKGRFKFEHFLHLRSSEPDRLDKVTIQKYIGLEKKYGKWVPITISVKVSNFILEKIKEIDSGREASDRKKIELRDKIVLVQERVYASRQFPEKLKQIIFQRDSYTCRICGRHRDKLIELGLHLEVDHVKEWEDGGETTYKNGQTLCSRCNKGKHHAKEYFLAKSEVVQ